ncbi:MAG: DUF362 domain-containing protein [Deltaproteobacteria bacterium]|nr:DUF362 domain-containing protein [Deltaproteobacteria bacterium]
MSDRKTGKDRSHEKKPLTRRELIIKGAIATGVTSAGLYLAKAPPGWPLSLNDPDGLRALPRQESFRLPDFRVPPPQGAPALGVGRGAGVTERLQKALGALGGLRHYIRPGDVVLVKPNAAFDRGPELGATTHPEVLEALVRMLLGECRAAEVRVADNPIESPADCFIKSGLRDAARQSGAGVYLPDGNAFRMLHTPGAELIENWWFFQRPFRGVNKVIGLSPVKDHNLCQASMGLKNWYGLLGGRRNQFHQDIHRIISDLALMIRPTLTILDGSRVLMRGGPTGGDPAQVLRGDAVAAGTDPVALDAWAYRHMLRREDELPEYLARAEDKGAGNRDFASRVKEVT